MSCLASMDGMSQCLWWRMKGGVNFYRTENDAYLRDLLACAEYRKR